MSAQCKILSYIEANPNEWHTSGQLQFMDFKNEDGTRALPRTIVRRLQNLEENSFIAVTYKNKRTQYRFIPKEWRDRYIPVSLRGNQNTLWKTHAEAEKKVQPQLQYSV